MAAAHIHTIPSLPQTPQVALYTYEMHYFIIGVEIHVAQTPTRHESCIHQSLNSGKITLQNNL